MRVTKLDGLRGVFSLMVVFYHYSQDLLPHFISNNFLIRESFTFVDFFFVLSGFVITLNYNNNINTKTDLLVYLKKRFIRLYPLLFFTTILFFGFEIISRTFFPQLINTTQSSGMLILKTIDTLTLSNSTPLFSSTGLGMNYPSWSISSEFISYLVFGIICLYLIGKKRSVFIFFIIVLSFIFSIWNEKVFFTGNYGFVRGLISFNVGYFVWYFSQKDFSLNNKLEYTILVLLLLVFYFLNSSLGVTKQIFGLFTIPLFFGLSIVTFLKTNGSISRFLDTKPLKFLGNISYSIYLNHGLFIIVIPRILFKIFKIPQNNVTEIIVFIITSLSLVFYSHLTFKFIELKGGKLLKNILLKNKSK